MLKSAGNLASLILAGTMLALAPVTAQSLAVKAHPTFRDLEYGDSVSGRLESARTLLNARIPVGTDISVARAIVSNEGARCGAAVENGQTRCTFSGFDGIEDHLHDIVWTIDLNSQNGRVADLDVTRASVGS